MDVTIIIPTYNPNKEFLKKINKSISLQKFKGHITIKRISGMGLAESLNYGIKNAKTEIIISLHQDCIPYSNEWLNELTKPLKDSKVIASVSKVELPEDFWKKFGFFARIISAKEQKIIAPLMDEKGCAYKKSAIEKVGYFDFKTFRTAGEDFDMWIKLSKIGKIAYPDVKVIHYHKHTFRNRIKKELQLSEAFGALSRKYKTDMPKVYKGFIKSIPLIGWPFFWINFPYKRLIFEGIVWIFLSFPISLLYSYGFWKGFLAGRQII